MQVSKCQICVYKQSSLVWQALLIWVKSLILAIQGLCPFSLHFILFSWCNKLKFLFVMHLVYHCFSCSSVLIKYYSACISVHDPSILNSCAEGWLTICKHHPAILDSNSSLAEYWSAILLWVTMRLSCPRF